jgi:hypothetical protein
MREDGKALLLLAASSLLVFEAFRDKRDKVLCLNNQKHRYAKHTLKHP